jgi:hypothetical protein
MEGRGASMASSLQLAQVRLRHHHVVSSRRPQDAARRRHRCSIAPHTTL